MAPGDAARHLRAADAVLISERQDATISAKLYDACAIGRPMVAACRGRLREMIEGEGLGLAVPHGDAEALAQAVRRLRSDPRPGAELVARARAFARENLRERHAETLARIVEAAGARE
jgi:glycosyltransferase involved in cell wall biosynthesis